jgi:hypothetical protein
LTARLAKSPATSQKARKVNHATSRDRGMAACIMSTLDAAW